MNDLVRFASSVEFATGKKRGRHPVFSARMFYPYAAERRLQIALRNELEEYIGAAYEAAVFNESFRKDSLAELSLLQEGVSDDLKAEISYAAEQVARKVSSSIAEMTEMTVGKPYYPQAAKESLLKDWEANFQMLCVSAESDAKKDISRLVQQAKNEGWNGKQLEKAVMKELPDKYANRASLIARTETAKLNTSVTLETYKEIGCQYYMWMATLDERVRQDHAAMNGRICSVADPTVYFEENPEDPLHPIQHSRTGEMVHMHPGEDFQCRCTMVMWDPVIDGKYEVKERPEEEEPEQKPESDPASSELEKSNKRLAEKEKELEKAESERKTVERELVKEKSAREAAEKTLEYEAEKSISAAQNGLEAAKRYEGITNDPGLKKCVAEVEKSVRETKKSGIASAIYEKIEALKDRIFGIQSEEDAMEAIGAKRFEKKKTPLQVVDGANPSKNMENCFITSALFEVRCRGWDSKAKPYDDSMIVFAKEPQQLFKGAKKVKFTSLESLKALLEEYEDGARFSINADFIVYGVIKSHSFSAYIESGRVRFVCLQEGKKDASVFFRKYKLLEQDNFFFRTDVLKLNYKNLKKVIE